MPQPDSEFHNLASRWWNNASPEFWNTGTKEQIIAFEKLRNLVGDGLLTSERVVELMTQVRRNIILRTGDCLAYYYEYLPYVLELAEIHDLIAAKELKDHSDIPNWGSW